MVAYTGAPGDVEVGAEGGTVVLVQKKPSGGWMWKTCGSLLLVALCVGGVLLFAVKWSERPEATTQAGETEALTENDAAEKADPHDTLRRISSRAKAAIHLEGSYEDDESPSSELEWRNGRDQAFAQGGLRLENNQIVIPKTGPYFVYSQASFRTSCGVAADGGERAERQRRPLSHRIWRYTDVFGSNVSLMSAMRTACQNAAQDDGLRAGQAWYNAIYLGAVFHLHKGDRLRTETNQLPELDTNEGKTFFGAFAL
ncbi:tumor necrosis factor b (TNF superfamily, member 2) [Embiotoca jacksoni]|uniref:tumor necrosis factor b (TNF superfamily, member 2) n=1 Tax=Embiotoca jacksoni TaxID=100190 RepID=UPI003703D21F